MINAIRFVRINLRPAIWAELLGAVVILCVFTTRAAGILPSTPSTDLLSEITDFGRRLPFQAGGHTSIVVPRLLHAPYPRQLEFSADGSVLISLAETIRLWDRRTGELIGYISGPLAFDSFAQLDGGRQLVTVDAPDCAWEQGWYYGVPQAAPSLRLWDTLTGKCLATRRLRIPSNATRLSITPIRSAGKGGALYVVVNCFQFVEPRPGKDLGGAKVVDCRLFGFQGKQLEPIGNTELDGWHDDIIWNASTRTFLLVAGSGVEAFDPTKNEAVWERTFWTGEGLAARPRYIERIVPGGGESPHVHLLLSSGGEDAALEWITADARTGKLLPDHTGKQGAPPVAHSYDPASHSVQTWDVSKNRKIESTSLEDRAWKSRQQCEVPGTETPDVFHAMAISGSALAVAEFADEAIHLFDLKTHKRLATPAGTVTALSRDGGSHVAAGFDARAVAVIDWNANAKGVSQRLRHGRKVSSVAVSTDGSICAAGDAAGKVQIWQVADGKHVAELAGPDADVVALACDRRGSRIVAGDAWGCFWQWKRSDRGQSWTDNLKPSRWPKQPIRDSSKPCSLSGEPAPWLTWRLCQVAANASRGVAFDADSSVGAGAPGQRLFVAMQAVGPIVDEPLLGSYFERLGRVVALNNSSREARYLLPAVPHDLTLKQIRCTNDGEFVSFVFDSGQVTIVDISSGDLESIIQTKEQDIVDVQYHPKQNMLVVASFAGKLTLWSTTSTRRVASFALPDTRVSMLSSRLTASGIDVILGTRDTGLTFQRISYRSAFTLTGQANHQAKRAFTGSTAP